MLNYIKNNLTSLPYPIGKSISLIPYSYRPMISSIYRRRVKEYNSLEKEILIIRKDFALKKVKEIAIFAQKNVPFYRDLYNELNVDAEKLSTFEDLLELPVVTKDDLQSVPLEYRSFFKKGAMKVNTGGSTGKPLEFYIEPNSVAHEWAHMHKVWAKLGFTQDDLRIVFSGRSDINDIVSYDSARHQLNADTYIGWEVLADKLLSCFNYYSPRYLHGYPSSIFDFILWLFANKHPLLNVFRINIRGIFLGSELPNPKLRNEVESLLNCKSISWYGHTERSVLAYEESKKNIYLPFLSYGYSEAVEIDGGSTSLVSTNYYNQVSPLIRYNTADLIIPNEIDGFLESFSIAEGRSGEFVLDRKNNKIFLTALIFGRHHKLFDICTSIQVHQSSPGNITILYVLRHGDISNINLEKLFDSSNVDLDFSFKPLLKPYKTVSGKTPLLVRNL
ncbi:MAG: hypothetical protein CML20_05145 [Rheinheimera sp.]|nr:hypothetical protein [Rheinheimera sp.]|tara:strand:+ start:2997 stop:4337 length:1341 start_codon:yes stop_codon:yes gene_type:complete